MSAPAAPATSAATQAIGDAASKIDMSSIDPLASAPTVVASPTPSAAQTSLQGVEQLKHTVAGGSGTIANIIDKLDSFGFTVAGTRFSLWTALVVVMVIVGVIVLARVGTALAKAALRRFTGLGAAQHLLAEKLITIAVWSIAILIGIDLLKIDLTALTVFSGAFGLAIGFGLQKTFGNLIAGIILLMDRSIKPGDVIAIADQAGKETFGQIRKIGIRAVSITTRNEREYLIPNENLMINQVENWSYSSRRVRMQVPVGVSYNSDMKVAQQLMLEAAKACTRVLTSPPPTVWMAEYGDSSVNFIIHCWITDPEMGIGNVRSDVLNNLWDLFKQNDIEIPFPQRDLNLRDNEQFQQLVAAIAQRMEKT